MDAYRRSSHGVTSGWIRALSDALPPGVGRWIGAGIAGTLLLVGSTLLLRGAAGAFDSPPPPPLLLATGLAAAVTAVAARVVWRVGGLPAGSRRERTLHGTLSAGLLLLGAAMTAPGGSVAALVPFWALLVVEEAMGWRSIVRRPHRAAVAVRTAPTAFSPANVPDDDTWQQVTRGRAPDGRETARGWLRAEFAAGQRTAVAHVAICPPLPNVPLVTLRQTAGPEARVKAAQILPYGIRFEIKLTATAERPQQVRLEFSAGSAGPSGPTVLAPATNRTD